jgi:hypothetical protein
MPCEISFSTRVFVRQTPARIFIIANDKQLIWQNLGIKRGAIGPSFQSLVKSGLTRPAI